MTRVGRTFCLCIMLAVLGAVASPVAAQCREIWVDQATGVNNASTPGDPNHPFKSITYALGVAHSLGWTEPWCVYIRPGSYDANTAKPPSEREAFPIVLGPGMIFEGTDPNTCIIDGQHLPPGSSPLLKGTDLLALEIRGLTLRNMNRTSGNGGGIELRTCSGVLEDCTISNCRAVEGAGMYLDPRAAVAEGFEFQSCTFASNTATNTGGGLRIDGPLHGNLTGCVFRNNATTTTSGYGGGGVEFGDDVTGNITNCTFSDNTSRSVQGGGFALWGLLMGNLEECIFTNNSVTGYWAAGRRGGGFWVYTLTGDVLRCTFSGNSIVNQSSWDAEGGGFCVETSLTGKIVACTFDGNIAEDKGAGFSVDGALTGGVNSSTFTSNRVTSGSVGGGFYVGSLAGGVADCSFFRNKTRTNGGGFFVNGNASGGVSTCDFTENVAGLSGDLRHGGGFYANGSLTGSVLNCRFINNEASWGAGFLANGNFVGDVRACEFVNDGSLIGNEALHVQGYLGGVIERCGCFGFPSGDIQLWGNTTTPTAVIRDCVLISPREPIAASWWGISARQKMDVHNNTMFGPGLATAVSAATVLLEFGTAAESSSVYNNIITQTQWGIRVGPTVDLPMQYNHFSNVDCIVVQDQSCLGNDISFMEILLDNFRHNYYEDPLFAAWPTGTWTGAPVYDPNAAQTTFADSAAAWTTNRLAGLVLKPDQTNPFRALIKANTATTVTVWGNCDEYGTPGNTYQIIDYHLSSASPCVDTGDPNFVAAPGETALDGGTRVWDGDGDTVARVDRGADEFGPFCVGDVNCDGLVDFGDINPFVQYLSNFPAWEATYSECDARNGDINGDGTYGQASFGDINPFVDLLSSNPLPMECP